MYRSSLLMDDYPLLVVPKLACKIGLNEAIILQQIHYWLEKSEYEKEGKKWIYNSYQDWQKQFPFWSEATIKRTLTSLKNQGLIEVEKFNRNEMDHTNWYTIAYEKIEALENRDLRTGQNDLIEQIIDQNDQNDQAKMTQSKKRLKASKEAPSGDLKNSPETTNTEITNNIKDLSSLPSLRSGKEDPGVQKTAKVPTVNDNFQQNESPPEKLLREKTLSQGETPAPKKETFQKPETLIPAVTNSRTIDQAEKATIENPSGADNSKSVLSNKDIIGTLGDYFLEVPGMSEVYPPGPKRKRVYALMGRLYYRLDCEPVFRAIDALRRKIESGGSINDPLRYVAGIAEKCAKGPIKNDDADEMYMAIKEIGEKNALTEDKRAFIKEWYAHEEKQGEEFFRKQKEERERLLSILEKKYDDPLAEEIAEIQREYARKKIARDRGKFKHVSSCLFFGEAN